MSLRIQIPGASWLPADEFGCRFADNRARQCAAPHSGLAPVELVLSIPLVLMVMALSVVVGNAACWKIRASVVARNEIWSNRKPRSDTPPDPRPTGWPSSASMNHASSRPLPDLNFPAFQNPLVHGPLPNITVNSQLFDPTLSVRTGQSNIQQTPVMLARLGDYRFTPEHPLIDGCWAYWQTGQWGNESRRIPDLYPSLRLDSTSPAIALANQINQTFRPALDVLDRDEELHNYDFHPRMSSFCTLDPQFVHDKYIVHPVTGVLGRIANVPKAVTDRFLGLYRAQLQALQNAMPPPADAAAQIAELERKIKILEDYRATL